MSMLKTLKNLGHQEIQGAFKYVS